MVYSLLPTVYQLSWYENFLPAFNKKGANSPARLPLKYIPICYLRLSSYCLSLFRLSLCFDSNIKFELGVRIFSTISKEHTQYASHCTTTAVTLLTSAAPA